MGADKAVHISSQVIRCEYASTEYGNVTVYNPRTMGIVLCLFHMHGRKQVIQHSVI